MRVALHYGGGRPIERGLTWYRRETLATWWPCWLFLTQPDRVIGLGWRGVLLIWREL